MGQTTYAGLKTIDYTGTDSTDSVYSTMEAIAGIQSSGDNESNMWKIDKKLESLHNEIETAAGVGKTVLVNATLSSSASNLDTYIATVEGLTAYSDKAIYLISFAAANVNTAVILNINLLGNVYVKKINDSGTTVVLAAGDIKPNVKYYYQMTVANSVYTLLLIGEDFNARINNNIIKNASTKSTIVDGDYLGIADSADSNTTKKTLFSVIKSTLKTYFDTLFVPLTRTINSKALSSNVTLAASDVGAVPDTRKVNNKALSSDITLAASDVGAVPTARTINSKALSSDIALIGSDLLITGYVKDENPAAIAATDNINVALGKAEGKADNAQSAADNAQSTANTHKTRHAAGGDDALSPADIGAVPTTRTINSKVLSSDITLDASDVGAIATSAKGVANGVPTLTADSKVTPSQASAKTITVTESKTLALTDDGTRQKCINSSDITITIPLNTSVAFPNDTEIEILRLGTGAVNIAITSGVTLNDATTTKTIGDQYTGAVIYKDATDAWCILGNVSDAT